METEPPGEPDSDKRTSTVETAEDVDVPEEPEAWDSEFERGDDLEPEPDEDEEEGQDPGDEERIKTRGANTPGTSGGVAGISQSNVARYTREVAVG